MNSHFRDAQSFLDRTDWAGTEPVYLAGDASARRYFRLSGDPSAVLMDATSDSQNSITPFILMANHLRSGDLSAPKIYAEDRSAGFLLLEDLGDAVFARVIDTNPAKELELYRAAKDVLLEIARMSRIASVPAYTAPDMAEMIWPAFEWYRWGVTGEQGDPLQLVSMMRGALEPLSFDTLSLRDFHAENLIWMPERDGLKRVGLLDFQDAMVGPAGYDLVSLLHDARRDVSPRVIETIQAEFAEESGFDPDEFAVTCASLSLQRNLRILGIFVRLALKFDKPRYIDFIPRVWRYVEACAGHPGLQSLGDVVLDTLPAPSEARLEELRRQCRTDRTP